MGLINIGSESSCAFLSEKKKRKKKKKKQRIKTKKGNKERKTRMLKIAQGWNHSFNLLQTNSNKNYRVMVKEIMMDVIVNLAHHLNI